MSRPIDADALIKAIDGNPFTTESVKSYIRVSAAKMPTIEPERKKGKWVNDEHDIPRCSECTYIPEYNRYIDDYYYSDYCPNCGADLTEDNDDA